MRCYKCGSVLSNNSFCNSCGADVEMYKKVVRLSNAYYNMGLAKAQIRDLTGACELLRRSIRFDKKNTNARNLLGLVYFEMGEAVQAFSEWVISKNIQPEKNMADEYIKKLQSNPVRLDTINQTIKKYNIALGYAKQGSDDLAVIQLKKVLNTNPNLIKGHLLLALLYMKKGDYERAKKPIMKVLKIDSNNPLGKKYLKEVTNILEGKDKEAIKEIKENKKEGFRDYDREQTEKEIKNGYDIITPRRMGYRESNSGTITVINIIIGVVVGVAMTFFLLLPATEKRLNDRHNKAILKLNNQIDSLNNQISDYEGKVSGLESEKEELSGQISANSNESAQIVSDYDNIIAAVNFFNQKDYINAANSLNNITNSERSETFKSMYDSVKTETYKQAAGICFNNGMSKLSAAGSPESYNEPIAEFSKCFEYDFMSIDYVTAADKLGEAYEKQYVAALGTDLTAASNYKQEALLKLANLVDNVFANTPGIDGKATEKVQAHILAITQQ